MSTLIVGCGYLGRRVGSNLAARQEPVYGTTRTASRVGELESLGIQPMIANVHEPSTLEALPSVDRVFYCVGFDRASGFTMREVYIDGLRRVLEALAGRYEKWVLASSTGVYGQSDGAWVDEETSPNPSNESGKICLEAENLVFAECSKLAKPCCVIRFAGLYGPGRIIGRKLLEAGDPIVGDSSKFINLIQIDDAARASVAVLDRGGAGRTYNVSDDTPVRRIEFYRKTAEILGCPEPRFISSEASAKESSNKKILNQRIKTELGLVWQFPSFDSGLLASLSEHTPRP